MHEKIKKENGNKNKIKKPASMGEKHFLCWFSSYIFMTCGSSPRSICDPINGDGIILWPIKEHKPQRPAAHLLGSRRENAFSNFFHIQGYCSSAFSSHKLAHPTQLGPGTLSRDSEEVKEGQTQYGFAECTLMERHEPPWQPRTSVFNAYSTPGRRMRLLSQHTLANGS